MNKWIMRIILMQTSFWLFLLTATGLECKKDEIVGSPGGIEAFTYDAAVPVLKGLETNPILRLAVSVPSGYDGKPVKKISCTLNPEILGRIQQIDLYQTGAEPFSASNKIASVNPATAQFDIAVQAVMATGLHFIWFSVVLKPDAEIGQSIRLQCTRLYDNGGRQVNVKQDPSPKSHPIGVVVRKAGDDNVHTYRIPGIAQTDKGTLIAVYDIRYKNSVDLPGNIDVGMSRSTDGGNTWEAMKVIMDMGPPHENNGVGDPAILFDPITRKIWVAALWSKGNRSIAGSLPGLSPDTTGQFVLVSSADDGLTWTSPTSITPQVKNPAWHLFFNGPGMGIAMKDGKLVFAAQYWDEKKMPHSTLIYSEDHGQQWKGHIPGPRSNTTESQVVETTPGTIMLNMRDNRGSYRSVATTNDMGTTWTDHITSYNALQDPICMGSIIKARVKVKEIGKDVLFFSNPNTTSGRYRMTIKASLDMGQTWLVNNQLLIDERMGYGYSCLTPINDSTVGLLYEGVRDLYFVKIPVGDIIK